jgi:hypothetical protein
LDILIVLFEVVLSVKGLVGLENSGFISKQEQELLSSLLPSEHPWSKSSPYVVWQGRLFSNNRGAQFPQKYCKKSK